MYVWKKVGAAKKFKEALEIETELNYVVMKFNSSNFQVILKESVNPNDMRIID